MEKRLSRTQLLFSLGFLFMLVFAVGAFFYGMKTGTEKTEQRLKPAVSHADELPEDVAAYQQQDLVSFYHTVFSPYREFQALWLQTGDKLKLNTASDPAAALKELASAASKQYKAVDSVTVSKVSPLLQDAQVYVLKALKLFGDAAAAHTSKAGKLTSAELLTLIQGDAHYTQAVDYALQAQQAYYASILKWAATIDMDIPGNYEAPAALTLEAWAELPLIMKHKIMADQLLARKLLAKYYPQDLASKVDDFYVAGNAEKLNAGTVQEAIDLLVSTDAVRAGDYSAHSVNSNELLPQLPFYLP